MMFLYLHHALVITFYTRILTCSGFVTSNHPFIRHTNTPVDRKIMMTPVDTSSHFDDNDEEQQHETLSSLSDKLNDLVVLQLEQFQQEKQQQSKSNSIKDDDAFASSTEEELVRLDVLHMRLKNMALNRTFVGPSSIAGRGLFASCDCAEGDLLTCYPGDAMVLLPEDEDEEEEDNEEQQEWTVLWGDHIDMTEDCDQDYVTKDWFLGNLIHAHGENVGIVGVPFLDQDPAYLGHFANDGAPSEMIPVCEADCADYVLASNLAANAINEDIASESHMVTVATRDIAQGEEIFVTYGPDYWLEQQQQRQWQPPILVDDEISTATTDKKRKRKSSPPTSSTSGRGFG